MSDPQVAPGSAKTRALRPLSKGIILNVPSRGVPAGGFLDLGGVISTTRGLRRRSAFGAFGSATVLAAGPDASVAADDQILAVEAVELSTDGTQVLIAVGRDWVYLVGPSSMTEIYRTYAVATCTISAAGTTVTGSGTQTFLASYIKKGDVIFVVGNTTPGEDEWRIVSSITTETALEVSAAFTYAHTAKSYTIYRKVCREDLLNEYSVSLVRNPNRLILASPGNELWKIDAAGTVTEFGAAYGATGRFSATCAAYWRSRVYAMCLDDGSDNIQRQRTRWTEVGDDDDFSVSTAFHDELEESTPGMRLLTLGTLLAKFHTGGIFIGRPSAIPLLPVAFERVNSGGIGLVGQRAVAQHPDAVFFQGQDNFYALTNNGLEGIGDSVVRDAIRRCENPTRCQMISVPKQRQIFCGVTRAGDMLEETFVFDVPSKSWSRLGATPTYGFSATRYSDTLAWDDWTTETWEDESETTGPSWDSEVQTSPGESLYMEVGGALWQYRESEEVTDPDARAVHVLIESPDLDQDKPDEVKFYEYLAMKIGEDSDSRTGTIEFTVQISLNEGKSWRSKGRLRIRAGKNEGWAKLGLSGSTLRYRLESDSEVPPYTIEEITVGIKEAGKERSDRWSRST